MINNYEIDELVRKAQLGDSECLNRLAEVVGDGLVGAVDEGGLVEDGAEDARGYCILIWKISTLTALEHSELKNVQFVVQENLKLFQEKN